MLWRWDRCTQCSHSFGALGSLVGLCQPRLESPGDATSGQMPSLDRPMHSVGSPALPVCSFVLCVLVVHHVCYFLVDFVDFFYCISYRNHTYFRCQLQIILKVVSVSFTWQCSMYEYQCQLYSRKLLTKTLRKPVLSDPLTWIHDTWSILGSLKLPLTHRPSHWPHSGAAGGRWLVDQCNEL